MTNIYLYTTYDRDLQGEDLGEDLVDLCPFLAELLPPLKSRPSNHERNTVEQLALSHTRHHPHQSRPPHEAGSGAQIDRK